jgi:site-specific DNA-methyltransferase (adenine-specific)
VKPYYADDMVTLYAGDCLDVLPTLPDASIDAVVCDPPYGLTEMSTVKVLAAIAAWMAGDRTHVPDGRGFMGREWDQFVPPPGVWDECMRVLKPGGHLLAFSGTRTVDLMTLSIRIAGFEIRESIFWTFGQGFPKSLDVGKQLDRLEYNRRDKAIRAALAAKGFGSVVWSTDHE